MCVVSHDIQPVTTKVLTLDQTSRKRHFRQESQDTTKNSNETTDARQSFDDLFREMFAHY